MRRLIAIVIIGLFFIGCGGNSSQQEESVDLPNISAIQGKVKNTNRIFKSLDCGKGEDCTEDDNNNSSDENTNNSNDDNENTDNSSIQTNTNAPEQDRNIVSEPFGAIQDIFTTQYSNFPANSTHHDTENSITRVIVDDNGIVHMIISHVASWIIHSKFSRHFQYYYMTYNPNTKKKSIPKKIFENKMLNNSNLPDERIKDFIMSGNKPIVVTLNSKNYTVKRYSLDGSYKTINIHSSGKIDSLELVNYNNKIYLTYRSLPDINIPQDWRLKAMEIYPNIGTPHNIVDEYLWLGRVHNDLIYFPRNGTSYKLDNNIRVIESSREDIGQQEKYLIGKVNIYDTSAKDLLLNKDKKIVLLNQDNSEEILFDAGDSYSQKYHNSNYIGVSASIYKDSIIMVYAVGHNGKWKVTNFNRYTKDVTSVIIGNHINQGSYFPPYISMNKNKRVVITDIDAYYKYSAQLTVADIKTNKPPLSEKEILLNESHKLLYGYYKDKNGLRWYISPVKRGEKVPVYSLMPIKNGKAGWGLVSKDKATIDLTKEQVTIGNIADNTNGDYYVAVWDETIKSNRIQSDIENIRNSTVDINWWFFKASNGSWYIINKQGFVYRFSYKDVNTNGITSQEYDWQKVDLDDAVPTFFIEDRVKKFRF